MKSFHTNMLFALLIISSQCLTQVTNDNSFTKNNLSNKGDFYYSRYEYKKAIAFYNRAYKKDTSNYYPILRKAEALSKLNLPLKAEECYSAVIKTGRTLENEYYLKYALTLLVNKKYKEAQRWFAKYNKVVENDIRAKNYLKSIQNKDQLYRDSTIQIVENVDILNTTESEINPIIINNKIIFASSRSNSIDVINSGYYNIFSADLAPGGQFLKAINYNKSINTNLHDGPISFSGDHSHLFFTRNIKEKNNPQNVQLGIYETNTPRDPNENLIPSLISIDGFNYSIGHPAVNFEGTVMYFISDAPDGYGGLDIYKSKKKDGAWEYPELLGDDINTKGDEMFPYLFNDSILFFASNGHGGLGGLDIFQHKLYLPNQTAENLGYPINSSYDDFSLFAEPGGESGYFCSNRPGGIGSDDIYRFNILKFKIKGSLRDALSKDLLEDAKISLLVEDGKEFLIEKSENGNFEFSIIPGEDYTLIIEKENYRAEKIIFTEDFSDENKNNMLIEMEPLQISEIPLEAGQIYNLTSGTKTSNTEFNSNLDKVVSAHSANNNSLKELTIVSKQLEYKAGDVFSLQLIKKPQIEESLSEPKKTLILCNSDTLNFHNDTVLLTLPVKDETHLTLQSDLEHINNVVSKNNVTVIVDSTPFFSEQANDLTIDQKNALDEMEYLLSLNFNTHLTPEDDNSIAPLSAKAFSIIPGTNYKLKVAKISKPDGNVTELVLPLTSGVKYDFNNNTKPSDAYLKKLNLLLKNREDVEINSSEAIDISFLSKELKLKEGEEFSFSLIPDSSAGVKSNAKSIITLDEKSLEVTTNEKLQINIPFSPEKNINIQTNIEHLQNNFKADNIILDIDTIPFFSEIEVDTAGYYYRYKSDNVITITPDQEDAIEELKHLLSLSFDNSNMTNPEGTNKITTQGFSIIPETGYILEVEKKSETGSKSKQVKLKLTNGVKYNFNNQETDSTYHEKLKKLLQNREKIESKNSEAIDISFLSKELELEKGEEFTFNIIPDGSGADIQTSGATLYLDDKTFKVNSNEEFRINVPFEPNKKVNIQTDIEHLQNNFKADNIILDIDTIPFFSEIEVDTTGYFTRIQSPESNTPKISGVNNKHNIIYRVQIAASRKPIPSNKLQGIYSGNQEIKHFEEEGWHKYYITDAPSYFEAKQVLNNSNIQGGFIVAYKDGAKLTLSKAMAMQYKERMKLNGMNVKDSVINIVTVNFDLNQYSLRSDEKKYLEELIINKLQNNAEYYAIVNGHTDVQGDAAYNYGLSIQRAEFVKKLIVNYNIDEQRVKTFSFGESQVLKECDQPVDCGETVHQINRRVEIILLLPN